MVTTDLIAAGVHFFADDPPESIARKALRVNLSDLAAKGAAPVGYLLALALPADWTEAWIRRFARGLEADQATYGISLIGGDTSRAANGLTVAVTAIGRLPRGTMVHRSGARPGDLLYVSGTIGDAALGLAVRLAKAERKSVGRVPRPICSTATSIRSRGWRWRPRSAATPPAALDVSDGLVGDFGHICEVSGVSGVIDASRVPLSPAAVRFVAANAAGLERALTGGDDYEILAAIAPGDAAAFERAARRAGVAVTRIGLVTKGQGSPTVLGSDGRPLAFGQASFDHFAR